ncbi:MAG: hypothetical protein ACTHVE_06355 [Senegalia sp. (in: firmicutes)]|uniref:hypothetical protein n=1 Tax=Senegalia sp. (in: firmicutes) TaxID=1924098 RepID=UPI003F9D036E
MITKKDIIDKMNELDFPKEKYWIVAGSALVMHEVKSETRDIDLGCTTDMIEELLLKGFIAEVENDKSRTININGIIEIFENWNVDKIEYINEIPVGSLKSIRKQKMS